MRAASLVGASPSPPRWRRPPALAAPAPAAAQLTYPPVTNRDFNLALFEQPALGSPRLIP